MLASSYDFISGFFTQLWRLYRSWFVPGTTMSPAEFLIGIFVLVSFVRFLRQFGSGFLNTSSGKEKE